MEKTEKKKSVLIVNTVGMDYEGISFVILNYLRNMPLEGLDLHITVGPDICEDLKSTLERLGTVHIIPHRKEDLKGYLLGLRSILKSGMDVLHVHGNSGTMAIETVLAKLCGVKNVIVHAHSTQTDHPLVNAILRYPMMICADVRVACSEASGKWLYRRWKHTVLNNAIDISRFRFDPAVREQCRREFGLTDEFLVGHIGYFFAPKNHLYLIDIFSEFHRRVPASKLLLVSEGPDFDAVVQKVKQLKLLDAVIFAGRRSDVERLYQAMDAFVMPSRWEGLPLVLLEAQSSGLPVLASDRITKAVQCTDRFRYLSIDEEPLIWAEELKKLTEEKPDRTGDTTPYLRQRGFDIRAEAGRLRELYLK